LPVWRSEVSIQPIPTRSSTIGTIQISKETADIHAISELDRLRDNVDLSPCNVVERQEGAVAKDNFTRDQALAFVRRRPANRELSLNSWTIEQIEDVAAALSQGRFRHAQDGNGQQ
jgi:hypothetical protein